MIIIKFYGYKFNEQKQNSKYKTKKITINKD